MNVTPGSFCCRCDSCFVKFYSKDETFVAAIESAKEKQRNSQDDFVTLFASSFDEQDPDAKLAAIFYTPELKDKVQTSSTNQEIINVIREEVEEAIGRSFNILRTRIDRFGVTQPNIQRLEGSEEFWWNSLVLKIPIVCVNYYKERHN